ncbi:hypothetical protein VMCG_00875 [Cytospora schulzeri]|uniref:Uncharacterized protein n=1 Tax=Cytospora schulzeri TaxID=448051 RepID=A0A423X5D1_9PEZI|nr:hypothetical protein VMCG_00875 [Valsa malicola]
MSLSVMSLSVMSLSVMILSALAGSLASSAPSGSISRTLASFVLCGPLIGRTPVYLEAWQWEASGLVDLPLLAGDLCKGSREALTLGAVAGLQVVGEGLYLADLPVERLALEEGLYLAGLPVELLALGEGLYLADLPVGRLALGPLE